MYFRTGNQIKQINTERCALLIHTFASSSHVRWFELVADSRRSELRLVYTTANGTAPAQQAVRLPERSSSAATQLLLLHVSRTTLGARVCSERMEGPRVLTAGSSRNQSAASDENVLPAVEAAANRQVVDFEWQLKPPIAPPDFRKRLNRAASRYGIWFTQRYGALSLYIVCRLFRTRMILIY